MTIKNNADKKKSPTILIVDDVLENLTLLTEVLRKEGYDIRAAKRGKEAVESIKYSMPDLVLLDIVLPDMSGFEVCRQIKENADTRNIPVMFLSVCTDVNDKIRAFSSGGVDYITKPFNAEEVTVRVATQIDIRKMRIKIEEDANKLKIVNEELRSEIGRRKAAEEAIKSERNFLSVTLQGIGDGVIVTDVYGDILITNSVAEEITGWRKDEARGKPVKTVFNIINEVTRNPSSNPVDIVLKSGKVVELENHTLLISRDGIEKAIADSAAPIFDGTNRIIGVVLVFRDITEKQKLIVNMQRTDKLESLGILVGGIAHDFNNLLNGIFGYIELAHSATDVESTAFSYLNNALRISNRAKDLTRQLLTFSKGGTLARKAGDLGILITESASFSLAGSSIICKYDISHDLWSCDFDENQIGQVIGNLVINAKQAMPNGGLLVIKLRNVEIKEGEITELPEGRYVKISISDTGAGISPEIIKRIFDLFFTTKESGNGLGLATCFSIIKNHDGHISVESVVGSGSVFHVYLPASDKLAQKEKQEESVDHKGSGTILIMDDEQYMLEILESRLKKMGYYVIQVKNGDEALSFFADAEKDEQKIDAAILDLTIPGGRGGSDIIEFLRGKYPCMSIIASSGYSENPMISNPEKFGFTGSICKPFSKIELARVLERSFNMTRERF